MLLSVSNIAWPAKYDEEMYNFLGENCFSGLEIAPTRIFPVAPYDHLAEAESFARMLKEHYDITISSIQSIWFGVSESLFGSDPERLKLIDYTKKAVDFARAMNCSNLVFGCPKNRAVPAEFNSDDYLNTAYDFFRETGNYASENGVCIAIEPNPVIYGTNFINTSDEAFGICRKLNNPGIKVNLDIGALIYNNESIDTIKRNISLINHIHISEPHLAPVVKSVLHSELKAELMRCGYNKFISIEMKDTNDINSVKSVIKYIKEIYL